MPPIRVINLNSAHYRQTQSLYHAIASRMNEASQDTIILCVPDRKYVCIGLHQRLSEALDRSACNSLGLPVMRRRVGGGTTYLDEAQLFYQCVFHHSRVPAMPAQVYSTLLAAPIAALRAIGLSAELRYGNEIEIQGRRIAGVGGGRIGEASVVVGNYLKDFNFDWMREIISAPNECFRKVAGQAMEQCITTLKREARDEFWDVLPGMLIREFSKSLNRSMILGEPTDDELTRSEIQAQELASEEFLNRNNERPESSTRRFKVSGSTSIYQTRAVDDGMPCDAIVRVRDGVIEQAAIAKLLPANKAKATGIAEPLPDYSSSLAVGSRWKAC